MKTKYLLIIFLFASITVIAQEKKNTYVKVGDQIEATLYHDNGMISQTGTYNKEGKLHGEWISYNIKGHKTAVAMYSNGEKVDTWMFYLDNKINEVTYVNSKVSKVKTWEANDITIVSNR